MNIETLAAIDIGTNAIRMLISNVDKTQRYPDFKKVTFIRVPIRLGEDVFANGKVSREKRELLIAAMEGFARLLQAYQVKILRHVLPVQCVMLQTVLRSWKRLHKRVV